MATGSAKSNIRPLRPNKTSYQHHRSSDPRCSSRSAAPSAGLLSLLASIAGFQPADAGPLIPPQSSPPSFLCPFVDQEDFDVTFADTARVPVNIAERGHRRSHQASNAINSNVKRNVPDKYEQGADGRWRKVNKYTLYGSTVCRVCLLIFREIDRSSYNIIRMTVILRVLRQSSMRRLYPLHLMERQLLQHQLKTSLMCYPVAGSLRIKQQEAVLLLYWPFPLCSHFLFAA
jgi:hypothetical protein